MLDGFAGGLHGVLRSFFKHRHVDRRAHDLQLLDGGGAINIAGDQERFFPLLLQKARQFSRHGGFARALQAAEL